MLMASLIMDLRGEPELERILAPPIASLSSC